MMDEWLSLITDWIVKLVKAIFTTVVDFLGDMLVKVLDWILTPLAALIAAIPVPSFLSSGLGIGSLLSGLPPYALYVIGNIRIGEAMAIIAAGVAFNLARKLATLGQW